jgi:hypothetical protein
VGNQVLISSHRFAKSDVGARCGNDGAARGRRSTRGRSRVRERPTPGSSRAALGNGCPYRDYQTGLITAVVRL